MMGMVVVKGGKANVLEPDLYSFCSFERCCLG